MDMIHDNCKFQNSFPYCLLNNLLVQIGIAVQCVPTTYILSILNFFLWFCLLFQ